MVAEINETWQLLLFFALIIVTWCLTLAGLGLLWFLAPLNYVAGFAPAIAWGIYWRALQRQRKRNAPLGVDVGQTFDDRCFGKDAVDSYLRRAKAESRRG